MTKLIVAFCNFTKAPKKKPQIIKGGGCILDFFFVSVQGPMAGCCEHRNKHADIITDGEFVEILNAGFTVCTFPHEYG